MFPATSAVSGGRDVWSRHRRDHAERWDQPRLGQNAQCSPFVLVEPQLRRRTEQNGHDTIVAGGSTDQAGLAVDVHAHGSSAVGAGVEYVVHRRCQRPPTVLLSPRSTSQSRADRRPPTHLARATYWPPSTMPGCCARRTLISSFGAGSKSGLRNVPSVGATNHAAKTAMTAARPIIHHMRFSSPGVEHRTPRGAPSGSQSCRFCKPFAANGSSAQRTAPDPDHKTHGSPT